MKPATRALLGAAAFLTHRYLDRRSKPHLAAAGATQAPASTVLLRNGRPAYPWIPKDRLLKQHCGAYTTARTLDCTHVFELSMHCQRLHSTASAILEREGGESEAKSYLAAAGPSGLKPLVKREIRASLELLDGGADYQVTLLLTWDTVGAHTPDGRGFDVFTFVQPLPRLERMVAVEAHPAKRGNPTIKERLHIQDVQWVSDRQQLEELQRAAGVNEVLMLDPDGSVTEGLQTNFFAATADGVLLTAPEDRVLSGTVRKVVLEVADEHGIPVRFECPNVRDLGAWDSCFICSTSRLVKPIRDLQIPGQRARREFPARGSVAHRIEELVQDAVRGNSEPLAE